MRALLKETENKLEGNTVKPVDKRLVDSQAVGVCTSGLGII